MAHSDSTRAQVLAALAVGAKYSEMTKKFGVSKSTMQNWEAAAEKSANSGQTGQSVQAGNQGRQSESVAINQIRRDAIAAAVLSDIAKVRADTIRQLAKIAPLAIRRIEDSTLPLRRKKVTDADGKERTELDTDYSPPRVDTSGALFLLVDVLGIKAVNNEAAPNEGDDAQKMVTRFETVRKSAPLEISKPIEEAG